jgi:hypothetical protein
MTKPKIDDAQIRETAYLLWLEEGRPQGRDQEHWHKAIDMLTPTPAKTKPVRKAPSKPRAAKATPKAGAEREAKAKAASAAKRPRAKKPVKSRKT